MPDDLSPIPSKKTDVLAHICNYNPATGDER